MTTGKHARTSQPAEPVKVMHEDDPVLSRRFPKVLNRRNVQALVVVLIAFTFLLSVLTSATILNERSSRRAAIQTQIKELACAIVAPFPDSTDFIRDLRDRYDCAPYDPRLATSIIPTHPATVAPKSTPRPATSKSPRAAQPAAGPRPPAAPSSARPPAKSTRPAPAKSTRPAPAKPGKPAPSSSTSKPRPATSSKPPLINVGGLLPSTGVCLPK